jgi:hypothetical protein
VDRLLDLIGDGPVLLAQAFDAFLDIGHLAYLLIPANSRRSTWSMVPDGALARPTATMPSTTNSGRPTGGPW